MIERAYNLDHWGDELPRISCQCVTYGRPRLLMEAVESFLRQDYTGEKELVILNDHPEVLIENTGYDEIVVINCPRRFRTVGEKRNACCALCSGRIILPWDDDDIHLPWRISLTLERMTNLHYFKPDRLWYWANGTMSERKPIAHAQGGWSKELFDQVFGYDHIQSGQDQTIERRFEKTGLRATGEITPDETFYIYRYPGTGSYHLSAHGWGHGFHEATRFVNKHVPPGTYPIEPAWKDDYVARAQEAAAAMEVADVVS